jgi:rod shape-determining protein MreD
MSTAYPEPVRVTAMKWLPFVILAVLVLVSQTTVVPMMAIGSVWPDWMFVLAVHYALWGPWPDAAIAAWVLGLVVGLQSADRVALHAFCFGGAAWVIIQVRRTLFRDHALTHVLVTLVFALAIQTIIGLCRYWTAPTAATRDELVWHALFTALYTALWAPVLHWPLIRLGGWTGLRASRQVFAHR